MPLTNHQTSLPESSVIKERETLNVASKIQFSSGVSINIAGGKAAVKMSKESVQQIVTTGIHIKKMSHAPHIYRKINLFSALSSPMPMFDPSQPE